MKRHAAQATQLYEALKAKGQTWTRNAATLDEWAAEFQKLESDIGSRKRIARALDWYCNEGCGALFVPMALNAETFRSKFEQVDAARKRLKGQQLRYFDDVVKYQILPRNSGSVAQREYSACIQKVEQQIQFVDDLAHNRVKLPAVIRNGQPSSNGKLTKTEKERLADFCIVSRDHLLDLMMQNPEKQKEWDQWMETSGVGKRLDAYMAKLQTEKAPF